MLNALTGLPLVAVLLEAPVVAWSLTAVAGTGYWAFARGAVRGFGPMRFGAADPHLRPPGGGERAYVSYWYRQVWTDGARGTAGGAGAAWRLLYARWLTGRLPGLLKDFHRPDGRPRTLPRLIAARFFGVGAALGVLAGALLAAAAAAAALLTFVLLLAVVVAALGGVTLGVRALDAARLRVRRIAMRCPYPGCYQRIDLPVYHCPGCQIAHHRLRPGRYGALRRVCECGTPLPTSFLGGRQRLAAECGGCHRPLPDGLGSARLVHVPLLGGTSSGKTMLLLAMVSGLRALADAGRLRASFALPGDRDDFDRLAAQVAAGGWAHMTQARLPRAVMLHVGTRWQRRLLYLYDPMGETLASEERVREQHYLAHADALVLVVDVLAAPQLRRELGLSAADLAPAADAAPSSESPMDTYARVSAEFGTMSRPRSRTPVAVVTTKRDALSKVPQLPDVGDDAAQWLAAVGLRNLVQAVRNEYGRNRFWVLSAREATGPGALPRQRAAAAEPALWLLRGTGLRFAPPKDPADTAGRQ
ncbi:TRAFAC clade GTPase domain-containing protein [Streptomyces sp. NPDC004031]